MFEKRKKENGAVATVEDTASSQPQNGQYAIMVKDINQIQAEIDKQYMGEPLGIDMIDIITVPGAGGVMWEVPTAEGTDHLKAISGIIVGIKAARSYWKDAYDGGGEPPDCFAPDNERGIGDPGGICANCPKNEFNSAAQGAGKACKEYRHVAFIRQNETIPLIIKAPATSIGGLRKYMARCNKSGGSLFTVITELTLEKTKFKSGQSASVIQYRKIGEVENPKMSEAYAEWFRPQLHSLSGQAVQINQQED